MKFGIRSAVDVVFKTTRAYTGVGEDYLLMPGKAWADGEPVLYFDSLKSSTTEGTAETVYAQGGAGNPRLIAWEGEKTVTFTFEDALISPEGMSILTGAGLVEATNSKKLRVHRKAILTGTIAGSVITVDLADEIQTGTETLKKGDIFGFVVDANGDILERLGLSTADPTGTVVKFATTSELSGDIMILVDFYVERSSGIKEITIEAEKFAGYFYIEGDTLFRRQSDGKDLPAQIIIPNAKIQTAFTFSMSPSGDPSTFTFTADAFPGILKGDTSGKQKMYALQMMES